MPLGEMGCIASFDNPYQHPNVVVPEIRGPAAVLTLRDLDALVESRLADARRAAVEEQRVACMRAWEEGRIRGYGKGVEDGRQATSERLKGLASTVHWLGERLAKRADADRTTIKAERDFIEQEAANVRAVENALRRFESDV